MTHCYFYMCWNLIYIMPLDVDAREEGLELFADDCIELGWEVIFLLLRVAPPYIALLAALITDPARSSSVEFFLLLLRLLDAVDCLDLSPLAWALLMVSAPSSDMNTPDWDITTSAWGYTWKAASSNSSSLKILRKKVKVTPSVIEDLYPRPIISILTKHESSVGLCACVCLSAFFSATKVQASCNLGSRRHLGQIKTWQSPIF